MPAAVILSASIVTGAVSPSITPTRSSTPSGRYIYGEVRDASNNAGLEGVVVRLYREDSGNWQQISEKTTDSNGHYAFGFSPVPRLHRIVETDPYGYMSDRVALPSGLDATVVNANTVEFEPPSEDSVGPIVFYDRRVPTATPKPTKTNTPTATRTKTPTAKLTLTPTSAATPTPTVPGEVFRIWLPIVRN